MKEYIKRTDAICVVKNYEIKNCPEYMQNWVTNLKRAILADITDGLLDLAASDVAPVVRCHSCKYFDETGYGEYDEEHKELRCGF